MFHRPRFHRPFCAAALFTLATSLTAHAETALELKFDQTEMVFGGGAIKLDTVRGSARPEMDVLPDSTVSIEATGLSEGWKEFLQTGHVDTGKGGGEASANRFGLATGTTPKDGTKYIYKAYMGFSGMGSGVSDISEPRGGTLYMVASPLDWGGRSTFGLFGTGHVGEGRITLSVDKGGKLELEVGGGATSKAKSQLTMPWDPNEWYFIAASWTVDAEPQLFARKMNTEGPAKSPEGVIGTAQGSIPATSSPSYDPIIIGSVWYNPGGGAIARDAANARIAYVRLENVPATTEQMAKAFEELGAK